VDLVLTVTPGRSGTGLLTALCREVLGLRADHEPEPRANFALRPALRDPGSALNWLVDEKLPAWAQHAGTTYVETSHLYCKGLLEPLLALGLRPRLVVLHRPASQVAASLLQLGVVPARSDAGDQVLLRPDDRGVLPLPGWEELSDYALCYWYALEIERRQALYQGWWQRAGRPTHAVSMTDLLSRRECLRLATFVGPAVAARAATRRAAFERVTGVNQNARSRAHPGQVDRPLPDEQDRHSDEEAVRRRTLPWFPGTPG
jgi:hypothetical protein